MAVSVNRENPIQIALRRLNGRTTKHLENERFLFGGRPNGTEIFADGGIGINMPRDRKWFAFSPIAPPISTALSTSADLRRLYRTERNLDLRPDRQNENVTIGIPLRRPYVRLHTAQALFDTNAILNTYPNEVKILWGGLVAFQPIDMLRDAGRRGIVVIDEYEDQREAVFGIPLLAIPKRLRPAGLNDAWKEWLGFGPRTLIAASPELLYDTNFGSHLRSILKAFDPVGVRTN